MSDFIGILIAIFFPYLIAKSTSGKNKEDFKFGLIFFYGFELLLVVLYYAFK
jgi:hypothetical protein